jgi:hypothetical protein
MATLTAKAPVISVGLVGHEIVGERVTIGEFVKVTGLDRFFPVIRKNTNGYPFVTFLKNGVQNSAQNIYFSKTTANDVEAGADVVESIKDLRMVQLSAADENGEEVLIWKICSANEGEGSYANASVFM